MDLILEALQRVERRVEALLRFLWGIIGEAVAWNQDEHALPQRLIRIGQITLAIMVFLLVLCAGGFVINNLLLKVIPASLIAMVFYIMITIFQWVPRRFAKEQDNNNMPWAAWQAMNKEDREEWKQEYSRDYALSAAVRGINGWLFWIVGILDLFILVEPWRSTNQLLVFGFLFLFWSINHFFRFLGTLRVVIKGIFAVILIFLFLVRFGMETNNELALRISSGMGLAQSKSQIKRVAQDVITKENREEAGLIPQQMLYEVVEGAVLVDREGNVKTVARNNLRVWVPQEPLIIDGKLIQPKYVLGVYKRAYLPNPGPSVDRPLFKPYETLEVWVNAMDLSRQVQLRPEPQIKKSETDKANNRSQSSARGILAAGNKIRWGAFLAVVVVMIFGYWAAGKWLAPKHKTLASVCHGLAIILIALAAWSYIIGPFGQAALAGESSRQKSPTPSAKLIGQNNQAQQSQNMPEAKKPAQEPQFGGRVILTSSQELLNGLTVGDVTGSKIYWHRYGWTRHKDQQMDGWAPFLPCGDYSIEGIHRRVVKFNYASVQFSRQDMPAYCVLASWQGETISWPEGFRGAVMTPIVLNPAIFGEESSVVIGILNVPADVDSLELKINAPVDRQLEWKSDQGSIVLEVVK